MVKTSKCTALSRPKGWKRFAKRPRKDAADEDEVEEVEDGVAEFAQLHMRTDFYLERPDAGDADSASAKKNGERVLSAETTTPPQKVEKEELIRGFKYGSSFAPCPEGQFPKLSTRKGIQICGFFRTKSFRREWSMGEVTYVWADPGSGQEQLALSAIVQAMFERGRLAIARWVSRDGADPKMGVLSPVVASRADYLLWVQVCARTAYFQREWKD